MAGSDRDDGVIAAARENAARAGVGDVVEFRRAAVSDLQPPEATAQTATADVPGQVSGEPQPRQGGLCLTNPPWGLRAASRTGGDARNVFARLGAVLAERCPTYRLGVLVNDQKLARQAHQQLQPSLRLLLGGKPAWLMLHSAAVPGRRSLR